MKKGKQAKQGAGLAMQPAAPGKVRRSAVVAGPGGTFVLIEGVPVAFKKPRLLVRLRAVWYALKFGLLPWQWYERACHYAPWGYWRHMGLNLALAWRWATWREYPGDINFEREVNNNY